MTDSSDAEASGEILNPRKKILFVGDSRCGKTYLLLASSNTDFPTHGEPSFIEHYDIDVTVDNEQVHLALWDTVGQECYDRLRALSYGDSDVILICFSVDRPDSLEKVVGKWFPEMKRHCPHVPIILVGMKKDLRSESNDTISYEEGANVATQIGALAYLECSAFTKEGVSELLEAAVRAMVQYHRKNRTEDLYIRKHEYYT